MSYDNAWEVLRGLRREAEERFPVESAASVPEREAQIFSTILADLPIGRSGRFRLSGEFSSVWATADQQKRWAGLRRMTDSGGGAVAPERLAAACGQFGFSIDAGGGAHTTIDYPLVLREGLRGVNERILRVLPTATGDRQAMLRGMRMALAGLAAFAGRFSGGGGGMDTIPWLPAQSFAQGLQCLWYLHEAIAISEGTGASISLGRFDQYLLPLYQADLARGISEAELALQLADFFRMLDNPSLTDGAVALNLGGRNRDGSSAFNALSRLILRVVRQLRLPAPLLAVRVDDTLAQPDFDLVCDPELFRIGQPTFYGEEACQSALRRRGVPEELLPDWAANSCMGLLMPGQEWSDMWGVVVVMPVFLEMALNGGRPLRGDWPLPLHTVVPRNYSTFAELVEVVAALAGEVLGQCVAQNDRLRLARAQQKPNPLVSALLDDCIERGEDRLAGGMRYRTLIVETFGLVNCADALLAIRHLVFETGEYPLAALLDAVRQDFAGQEGLRARLQSQPKYGNAEAAVDLFVAEFAGKIAGLIRGLSTPERVCAPSLHTLTGHIARGAKTAASLDGRREGEPLAKNAGTRPGCVVKGQTALILSASAIDQADFCGGAPLDLSFPAEEDGDKAGQRQIQGLLRTYFSRGGLQVQVNALSPAQLEDAIANPREHADLIVRIGGYSARFIGLSPAEQRDFVARFSAGV